MGRRNTVIRWCKSRKLTLFLVSFIALWYAFQMTVSHVFGRETAIWIFYIEQPPDFISPGLLFGPISHEFGSLTHIGSNAIGLLLLGSIAEPRFGLDSVFKLVIGGGYFATILANLTGLFGIHLSWMLAGMSGGVLALLAYTGLSMRNEAGQFLGGEIGTGLDILYRFIAALLLLLIPAILILEPLIYGFNSGHTAGIFIGVGYYFYTN